MDDCPWLVPPVTPSLMDVKALKLKAALLPAITK
jgi:hypothetical protein